MGNWWWARAKIVGGSAMPAGDQSCPSHPAPRVITLIVVIVVAIVAAVISYSHMVDVAVKAGEPQWRAILVPIPIDGLMVAAALTCYARQRARLPGSHLAWGALGSAILTSILTNIADARPEPWPIFLAASAPVGLAWAFEMLLMQLRAERHVVSEASATSPETSGGYTQPTMLPTPGVATSATPTLTTMQRTSQTSGFPPHQAPALTPPAREAPTANPVTATPSPTTQSPRHPVQQLADESMARSPNGQTGRGSTAASSNGSGTRFRDQTRGTRPRPGTVLSEEEWALMDGYIETGVPDWDIAKRMGRSEATVKKRRLQRVQRNGNERMASR